LPQAIADYDAALKVDPKLASALFGRGVARHQMDDVSEMQKANLLAR
jgi:hypothetical protein